MKTNGSFVLRRGLPLLFLVMLCTWPQPAAADGEGPPLLTDPIYEVSGTFQDSGLKFPGRDDRLMLSGVRITERNGIFGGGILGTLLWLPILLSGSQAYDYEGTTHHPGYKIDWYRKKSAEERARERAEAEDFLTTLYRADYQIDFDVYFPTPGVTNARGFSLALFPFTIGERHLVEFGLKFSYIKDRVEDVGYRYFFYGAPVRLIFSFFESMLHVHLQVDLGVGGDPEYDEDDEGEKFYTIVPVSLGFTFSPLERLFIRANATLHTFGYSQMGFGYSVELGARF